jgi:HlyD family secretion protein
VYAPSSGVLLARGIEPGEVVGAGASVMTIGVLENLNITVYVPEDRYGALKLGQKAKVTVDSFPGRVFIATVTNISDKAEYTPRNVQTVEGRKTTVYAVKLSIANLDLALKIGMPADVSFE